MSSLDESRYEINEDRNEYSSTQSRRDFVEPNEESPQKSSTPNYMDIIGLTLTVIFFPIHNMFESFILLKFLIFQFATVILTKEGPRLNISS